MQEDQGGRGAILGEFEHYYRVAESQSKSAARQAQASKSTGSGRQIWGRWRRGGPSGEGTAPFRVLKIRRSARRTGAAGKRAACHCGKRAGRAKGNDADFAGSSIENLTPALTRYGERAIANPVLRYIFLQTGF